MSYSSEVGGPVIKSALCEMFYFTSPCTVCELFLILLFLPTVYGGAASSNQRPNPEEVREGGTSVLR